MHEVSSDFEIFEVLVLFRVASTEHDEVIAHVGGLPRQSHALGDILGRHGHGAVLTVDLCKPLVWPDAFRDSRRAFVQATDYRMDDQILYGSPDHPVVNVSWTDALAYSRWLEYPSPHRSKSEI